MSGIKRVSKTVRMSDIKWGYVAEVSEKLGMSENAFINYLVSHSMGSEFSPVGENIIGVKTREDTDKVGEAIDKVQDSIRKDFELPKKTAKKLADLGVVKGIEPKDGYKPISKADSVKWSHRK